MNLVIPDDYVNEVAERLSLYQELDDSKTSLEIIRIPYRDFFFKSQFPESIQKFIPKIDSKKIKKYSMNNISLVESFTQNLQITRDYKIYIETAKEMISAI